VGINGRIELCGIGCIGVVCVCGCGRLLGCSSLGVPRTEVTVVLKRLGGERVGRDCASTLVDGVASALWVGGDLKESR
jgi:hypothetical protein